MTTQNNNSRNIDPEKVTAERLMAMQHCLAALLLSGHMPQQVKLFQDLFNGKQLLENSRANEWPPSDDGLLCSCD